MIQLSALSKTFGDRVLLDAVSWQIDDRERLSDGVPSNAVVDIVQSLSGG